MAVCHGANSPYGCGHHAEHARAARKGWETRRRGDVAGLRKSVGPDLEDVHKHRGKGGKRIYTVQVAGQWFEMDTPEYRSLVRAGKADLRDERTAARRAERAGKRDERYRELQERESHRLARAELREVRAIIKKAGGIRPSISNATGRERDASEYRMLPSDLRRRDGRLTMDTAATEISQHMPWLHIDGPSGLVDYFERAEDVRHNRRARGLAA